MLAIGICGAVLTAILGLIEKKVVKGKENNA